MPVFQPKARTLKCASPKYTKPRSLAGMYTSFVCGLYDIGIQLWAPPGPGSACQGLPVSPKRACGFSIGRPVFGSRPVAQFTAA